MKKIIAISILCLVGLVVYFVLVPNELELNKFSSPKSGNVTYTSEDADSKSNQIKVRQDKVMRTQNQQNGQLENDVQLYDKDYEALIRQEIEEYGDDLQNLEAKQELQQKLIESKRYRDQIVELHKQEQHSKLESAKNLENN